MEGRKTNDVFFMLDESRNVVPCGSQRQWAYYMQHSVRDVGHYYQAVKHIPDGVGGYYFVAVGEDEDHEYSLSVHTDFRAIDLEFGVGKNLFITKVYGGELDGFEDSCSNWVEAEAMHSRVVAMVMADIQEAK